MRRMDTREVQLRAFNELSSFAPAVEQRNLHRLAAANLDLALSLAAEVARVTLMARSVAPEHDAAFDTEAQGLIRLSALRPAETLALFQAGIHADREAPHPAGVRIAPDVFQKRIDRVMQCLT